MTKIRTYIQQLSIAAVLFIAGCGGGGSSSGGGSAPMVGATPAPALSIVALGDSIGNGFGVATPWPVLLGAALGAPVDNNSVTNMQTSFGLSIIEERLDAINPTHVVILQGTNDALRGSVGGAISNLQAMVDIANARGVIAVVATLPPIPRSASENARAADISVGIRGLAGATIAEVRGAMGNGDGLIVDDGVHPNQQGQQVITDVMLATF
ncbi:MAG: hypothetical protein HKN50_12100 [Gammaproteobacteria bacterium]|nr:hypothetical protein [Gammaproteobacteria bacterium]